MSELYIWGKPIVNLPNQHQTSPFRINNPDSKIESVSSGENHVVVVTEDGVFGMGDNT